MGFHFVRPRVVVALFTLVVLVSAGRAPAVVYNGAGGPLQDDPGAGFGLAEFPIVISGTGATVESVNAVTMTNLTHTWFGDTQFTLLSPDGTLVRLASPREPEDANLNGTYRMVVDPAVPTLDEAAVPLGDADNIPSGTYAIATYLSTTVPGPRTTYDPFDGKLADGTWTLRIEDFGVGDTGALGSWALDVTYVPEPGALGSFAALALLALRRRCR